MGIPEEDLPGTERWRNANPAIVQFWSTVEAAAGEAVNIGRAIELWVAVWPLARELDSEHDLDFLTIRMPNGRKLCSQAHMGINRAWPPLSPLGNEPDHEGRGRGRRAAESWRKILLRGLARDWVWRRP